MKAGEYYYWNITKDFIRLIEIMEIRYQDTTKGQVIVSAKLDGYLTPMILTLETKDLTRAKTKQTTPEGCI